MTQNKKKKSFLIRSIFIAAVISFLLIAVIVFSALGQEQKPDPFSEAIIRKVAARVLSNESNIHKEPNDLTDEDFSKITELRLGLSQVSSSLTSPSQELADIKILEKCSNLKTLRLENINYPKQAIPIWMEILSKFGIYDLKKRFTIDLRPIENLHSLQLLQIYNVPVKNIKPLTGLTNLQRLFLENLQLSDLKPLKELKNLKILALNDSKVSDLEPLKDLVSLQNLFLDGTQVSDLEPLKGLKSLDTLIVSKTLITDLEPLKDMVTLRQLFVYNSQVSNLEPIKGLVNLQSLYISGCNNISDQQVNDLQKALPNLKIER
jgi:Leucine-rich repeat (LRR) protein